MEPALAPVHGDTDDAEEEEAARERTRAAKAEDLPEGGSARLVMT